MREEGCRRYVSQEIMKNVLCHDNCGNARGLDFPNGPLVFEVGGPKSLRLSGASYIKINVRATGIWFGTPGFQRRGDNNGISSHVITSQFSSCLQKEM